MVPQFKRVVIYGVGLLGGSLGMALRRRGMAETIVGLGRSRKRLERGVTLGALDEFTTEMSEAMHGADALISCVPPRIIRRKWSEFAALAEPGLFATDVGSVKGPIVRDAEAALGPDHLFVGSHPMAGSEKGSIEAARGDLFEGVCCFVTPTDRTPDAALTRAVALWRALGARAAVMTPERHDRLIASISHLPHLFAATLVEALYSRGDSSPLFRTVVGNGFKDTTRIAAGDGALWEQIFSENSEAVTASLDEAIELLRQWREIISRGDRASEIIARLSQISENRHSISPEEPDSSHAL